ncbi:MAG TPA: hypothetical protein VFS66_09560 [Acidimicrobiia bacterium]|nr:hypothetical protein [Acidimicrobiia bacterium]
MHRARSGWLVDVLVGGVAGALVAVVAALNLMILLGPTTGYETSLGELFAHNPLAGVLVVTVLLAGPILGVVLARRFRRTREKAGTETP